MVLDQENIARIKNALRFKPRGMSITALATNLKMNRNSVAKYLEILVQSGEAEGKKYGSSRIYTISQRVPASAMMRFSSDMILMIDHTGKILQANDSFLSFSGIPRELLVGQDLTGTHEELIKNLPVTGYLGESEEDETRCISRYLKRDGKDFFFVIKLVPTLFDDHARGLTIIIEDISEQKRAELALAEREQMYHDVIENIQDIFYRSDNNGNLIMASPSWAHLLGYDTVQECLGRSIANDFYLHPHKRQAFLDALKQHGFVSDYEVALKKKDGTPAYVSTNSHIYYRADGSELGVEGIFRDISERRAYQARIHTYISQLEHFSLKLLEFIELPRDADIFTKIARDLQELLPDALLVVNSYDSEQGILTVECTTLDEQNRQIVVQALGRDPVGFQVQVDAMGFSSLRTGNLYQVPFSLHETLFRAVPESVCNELSLALSIGKIHAIGLVCEGTLLGNVLILQKSNTTLSEPRSIQNYIRQASIVLKRSVAEHALKKSEELFSNIAKHSPLAIAIVDTDGRYSYINRHFSGIFGYTLKDFQTGREWFLLAFPDSNYRKTVIAEWKEDLASAAVGESRPRIHTVRCKDGGKKEIFFRPVTLSDGKQCIVYEDITERRETERVRKLLASIVESTDDAIIGKTPDGIIISWNSAAEHIFGYTRNEIVGRHISIIVPHELLDELAGIFEKISRGIGISNLETRRVRKDGTLIDVGITISPIIDEEGRVMGVSTISREISEKKAEERLRNSEEKYRNLVENLTIGVYRSTGDPRGKFVWGNPCLLEILGYSSFTALKSVDIVDIFAQPGERADLLRELQRSGFVKNRKITLKRSDGMSICVSVTAVANIQASGEITSINGIVEDITHTREIEKQVKSLHRKIHAILEFIPDPAFIINENREVCAWNAGMEILTGVKQEEILGKTSYSRAFPFFGTSRPVLIDLIDTTDEDLQKLYPVMAGMNIHRKGGYLTAETITTGLQGKQGVRLWAKAGPLTDEKGNRIGAIEIIRDITTNRNIEKYLSTLSLVPGHALPSVMDSGSYASMPNESFSHNEEILSYRYLSGALKHAGDHLAILDLSGRCLWANDALKSAVLGEPSSELVGASFAQFVAPEFRKVTLDCLNVVRKEGKARIPAMLLSHTGRIPVEIHFSGVNDEKDELLGYLAISRAGKKPDKDVRLSETKKVSKV